MSEPVTILIVDDDTNNRKAIRSLLHSPDYHLLESSSGEEALGILLDKKQVALILLDVQMPTMNGFEVAKLIKQRKKTEDIPIIFISGHYIEETDIFQGYQLGAFDYITKPFPDDVLKSKVAMFVALFQRNEAIKRYQYYLGLDQERPVHPEESKLPIKEGVLDKLLPEYQVLTLNYVRSMRLREVLPTNQTKTFIERIVAFQFGSRDLIRLHLKVLKKLENQLIPSEAQAFSLDARLLLIELMGDLVDHYRPKRDESLTS